MNLERDPFRTDLRSARLCMELDCNTIFDAGRDQDCPACGSAEAYPLETWLNRRRATGGLSRVSQQHRSEAVQAMGRAAWGVENARRSVRAVGQRVQARGL
jgi:hypothetical protein